LPTMDIDLSDVISSWLANDADPAMMMPDDDGGFDSLFEDDRTGNGGPPPPEDKAEDRDPPPEDKAEDEQDSDDPAVPFKFVSLPLGGAGCVLVVSEYFKEKAEAGDEAGGGIVTLLMKLTVPGDNGCNASLGVNSMLLARQLIGMPPRSLPAAQEEDEMLSFLRGVCDKCDPAQKEQAEAVFSAVADALKSESPHRIRVDFDAPTWTKKSGKGDFSVVTEAVNLPELEGNGMQLEASRAEHGQIVLFCGGSQRRVKYFPGVFRTSEEGRPFVQRFDASVPAFLPVDALGGMYRLFRREDTKADRISWLGPIGSEELRRDAEAADAVRKKAAAKVAKSKKRSAGSSGGDSATGKKKKTEIAWHPLVAPAAIDNVKVMCALARLMDHVTKAKIPQTRLPLWKKMCEEVTAAMVDEAGDDMDRLLVAINA